MNKVKLKHNIDRLLLIVEKCGGPGSGVPGPCPTGRKRELLHPEVAKLKAPDEKKKLAKHAHNQKLKELLGTDDPEKIKNARRSMDRRLKEILERAKPYRAVQECNLEDMLWGGFKNQFETGTTRGSDNLSYRKRIERDVVGVPENMKPEDRPKYGYLSEVSPEYMYSKNSIHSHTEHYGDVIVEFHPDVKKRSTVTFQDSFNDHNTVASPYTKPSIDSIDPHAFMTWDVNMDDVPARPRVLKGVDHASEYVELQIHGQLTPKDIKAVYLQNLRDDIPEKPKMEDFAKWIDPEWEYGAAMKRYNAWQEKLKARERLVEKLKSKGIQVKYQGHPEIFE